MGFHTCEYCTGQHVETSSGDTIFAFANGNHYKVPDMILHYIADHNYLPPMNFIDDVMNQELLSGTWWKTKGFPDRIGYLSREYPTGHTPQGFFKRLWSIMNLSKKRGSRRQTRGI